MTTALFRPTAPVAAPGAVRRAVAVLVSRFPTVTETFIQHEIDEMERQGQPVVLVPLLRDAPPVVHHAARAWIPRAWFTPFLSPGIVAVNLRAMARAPHRYVMLLVRLVVGTAIRPAVLLRTLALFPKSVYLAEQLRVEGVRHVHAHFATHPATTALIIAALTDITFSFTAHAHDIFVDQSLLRWKIAHARFVRVISQFNAGFLTSRYPRETHGKLRVIHMGIPIAPAGRRAEAAQPRLLCVAALRAYKGVSTLVDACRRLRAAGISFRCDVVGEGPERRRLERQIARAGLCDAVHLLGARPQHEVAALLGQASVFVLPSVVAPDGQMEGIPVALMEAMATGLPVVASALSGIPELVEDGVSGLLVEPGDAVALAAALQRLVANAGQCTELAAGARRAVARDFRLKHTVAELVAELDRHNPGPGAEVRCALAAPVPLELTHLGWRRSRETRDSCVLELIATHNGKPREFVVKVARSRPGESAPGPARARREYAVLAQLTRLLAPPNGANGTRLSVARPLALDAARASLWLERCAGRRLDHLVRAARFRRNRPRWTELRDGVKSTGRWLRHFQGRTEEPLEPGTALSTMVARAAAALDAAGLPAQERHEARERLVMLAEQLPDDALRVVGRHGDFWPGNVFVAEHSVQVIDFEGFGRGLPCEDVGWFLVTLELLLAHPVLRTRRVDLGTAFLSGYRNDAAPLDPATLGLGRAAAAATILARLDPPLGRWHRTLRRILVSG